MNFTPIHTFRPELQKNEYGDNGLVPTGVENEGYGKQRYIALTNGISENYNNTKRTKNDDGERVRVNI